VTCAASEGIPKTRSFYGDWFLVSQWSIEIEWEHVKVFHSIRVINQSAASPLYAFTLTLTLPMPPKLILLDKSELRRLEFEHDLFERALRQLTVIDALPATRAYLKNSQSVEDVVARTTANLPNRDGNDKKTVGSNNPPVGFQGSVHSRTVLHSAAMHGRDEALHCLLEGAVAHTPSVPKHLRGGPKVPLVVPILTSCVNAIDGHGDTALMLASRGGHLECARMLLSKGAMPNFQSKPTLYTAMHCAAGRDEREMLNLLYHFDADPTLISHNGLSPAQLAHRNGHLRLAVWLEWAETDWKFRHPPRGERLRIKFVDCLCSFCSVLRSKNGNSDDPSVAVVGVWRKVDPGYTQLHDPQVASLIREAERRSLDPLLSKD
jgi:hypothetical protein